MRVSGIKWLVRPMFLPAGHGPARTARPALPSLEIIDCFDFTEKTKENKSFLKHFRNTKCNSIDCHDKSTS